MSFDAAAACLVVHFMPDPVAGLTEMARVTRAGGWTAATVWDLVGSRAPMWPVWAAFAEVPVSVTHTSFEEWWEPYLKGVEPIGEELAALDPTDRQRIRDLCHERLGDGPFDVNAVAYAVRGRA